MSLLCEVPCAYSERLKDFDKHLYAEGIYTRMVEKSGVHLGVNLGWIMRPFYRKDAKLSVRASSWRL